MNSIFPLLQKTHQAAPQIAALSDDARADLVRAIADGIEQHADAILAANQKDLDRMDDTNPKKDRLLLNEERIADICAQARQVADLPDPAGQVFFEKKLDNGLQLQKLAVPLGVVGVIYEARPNVTVDVVALALRSGNAVVLRGGSDAEESNKAIVNIIHQAGAGYGVALDNAVQLLPTDRAFVKELLEAKDYVDIIIPRGSQNLIQFVRENSKIPTIETGAGVCHTYVDEAADLEKARDIVWNAKLTRPSVCNSLDTIIVHKAVGENFLPMLVSRFAEHEVEMYADERAFPILDTAGYERLHAAEESDFGREFLGFACSVKVVESLDEALAHIAHYSSKHSEAIVSEHEKTCDQFLRSVDAAAVYSNASTRFTDGGVFGLGAEIGISTQKLHARGPFALEKLVTEKWVVRGDGQVRE